MDNKTEVKPEEEPSTTPGAATSVQHIAPKDFDRFARSSVIASVQPYHAIDDGRWAERRIGPERVKTTYAFRTLLERKDREHHERRIEEDDEEPGIAAQQSFDEAALHLRAPAAG